MTIFNHLVSVLQNFSRVILELIAVLLPWGWECKLVPGSPVLGVLCSAVTEGGRLWGDCSRSQSTSHWGELYSHSLTLLSIFS